MLPNKHNSVVTLAVLLALVGVSKPAKASLIAQSDTAPAISLPDAELNPDLEDSGTLIPDLENSGKIDSNLEDSGELNSEVGGSGELDSDFTDSGELNPDLEGSGQPLSNNEIEATIADNEIIVQTQEESEVEVAAERNNNWWWLIPLLGIPLLALIIALGGRRRSDREPAIGNAPDYNDPDGGIGIAAPNGDGGNLSAVGTNVNADGNLSNVVGNAGVATSRLGGTMAAGATNLVSDRRAIEEPDLDLERSSEQNASLIEDSDPEPTSVVEIPSDSVSEFTGQETKLQVSNQPTMLQTNDEPDDSIDLGFSDDVAQGSAATPNLTRDSEVILDETTTTSVGWVDTEQLSDSATGRLEPLNNYSAPSIGARETVFDDAVAADEATEVAKEFPGDYVLEEETETFFSTTLDNIETAQDRDDAETTAEEISFTLNDESTTLDNIEAQDRDDTETTVEEISFTLDDESTTLDNIETAKQDEATTTAELDLDLTDKTPQPDTLTAKDLGGTAFVLDQEDTESTVEELSLDLEPDNVADLRQDEGEFTIDDEALEATPPQMDLSTEDNVADLRQEDEATTTAELNLDTDVTQSESETATDFGGTAFVLDQEDTESTVEELSLDLEPDNVADLRQDEGEFTIDDEALEATPPEMDLSTEDNVADLRQDEGEFSIGEEATTTAELNLDTDAPQSESETATDFGGTAFILDQEDTESTVEELSLDLEPDNVADLRQDEGEFTIDDEALEATPPQMDLSTEDNVADLRQDEGELTLEDEATQTAPPQMDLSTDDDSPSDRPTGWGSAAIAGGALGGAAGAFLDRENTPERESIDAELVFEEDTAADLDLSLDELDDEWGSGSHTASEEVTTTEPDLFGEFEPAQQTEFADDAIASPDAAMGSQELTLEEITLEELENTSDVSLEEIAFDEPTATGDLTLEEMTFDEPATGDLNLEEMTLEDLDNISDVSLEEITFDESTATSDLTLEEMTFDEPANSDRSLVDDLEGLSSDISLDELGFEEVEPPRSIDNTFDPLRDNTADISSLDDDSEDLDNISEWLESLETPKQDTEDISEWLNSLNADEISLEDNPNDNTEQLEEADDVSFQFLEDLLERDSKTDRDDR